MLGPGFISGAADDDPTAIATYTQAGAAFGYRELWTALFTLPFMVVIQEMCGRIGMVTGRGLAGVIRDHYPRRLLYFAVTLLCIANIVNIGADLGAMAATVQMLLGLPVVVWLLVITGLTLALEVFVSYRTYAKYLRYLALVLIAYVGVALLVRQDWGAVLKGTLLPSITWNRTFLLGLVAILGTNLSPYLFFWQASEEVEEEVAHGRLHSMGTKVPRVTRSDDRRLRWDTVLGMLFSNIIVFFIAIAAASTLGHAGITSITTPQEAARALAPLAGNLASLLFALGILGSGLLAVPVLAGSASYALSESLGWREGLYRKFRQAHGFYGVIIVATLVGLLVNLTSIQPFELLIYAAALNAILAPPLLAIILVISRNRNVMGEYASKGISTVLGGLTVVLMAAAAVAFLVLLFKG